MAIRKSKVVKYAGMAELADARDLKSREIFSRTGSTPASGTIYIAEWSSLVARRAHNPKVMRFKSHLRNQMKPKLNHRFDLGFLFSLPSQKGFFLFLPCLSGVPYTFIYQNIKISPKAFYAAKAA